MSGIVRIGAEVAWRHLGKITPKPSFRRKKTLRAIFGEKQEKCEILPEPAWWKDCH